MGVKLHYRTLKTGNISPRLIIYKGGRQIIENIDLIIYRHDPDRRKKERACEAIKSKREYEMIMGQYQIPVNDKPPRFSECVEEMMRRNIVRKMSYHNTMNRFIECIGDKLITDITTDDVQTFRDYLVGKYRPTTIATYFSTLKAVLNDAGRKGYIWKIPGKTVKSKSGYHAIAKEILTIDEFRKLLKQVEPEENKLPLILAYYTGMGKKEVFQFGRDNVRNGVFMFNRAKTNVQVRIPAKSFVIDLLEQYNFSWDHLNQSATYWNDKLKQWTAAAGIRKKITFYCFRHSFAVNVLIASDGDIEILRRYMGHTSYTHTMKYLEYYRSVRGNVIDRLPDL